MGLHTETVVAVLGDYSASISNLAKRVQQLGHRTLRAKTLTRSIELADRRNLRFSAVLLDPEIHADPLGPLLDQVRRGTRCGDLVYLAAGKRPNPLARERLRRAGVELALWDPASDHDLRFQLNRAMSLWTFDQLRGESRAPTDWSTRIFSRGREKAARIYSFSCSGAFLATSRPSSEGADLTLELPLPSGPVRLPGRVVYTNVPGNRHRPQLPNGMAVEFEDLPVEIGRSIRQSVDQRASDLAT